MTDRKFKKKATLDFLDIPTMETKLEEVFGTILPNDVLKKYNTLVEDLKRVVVDDVIMSGDFGNDFIVEYSTLDHVRRGDSISSDFMNTIINRVNAMGKLLTDFGYPLDTYIKAEEYSG